MILLPVTLYDNDLEVMIEDQVQFVFKDIPRRVFHEYKVGGISRGKMLLDFFGNKATR